MASGQARYGEKLMEEPPSKENYWDSENSVSMPLTLVHGPKDWHQRGRHLMNASSPTIARYKLDDNNSSFALSFYYVAEIKLGSPPRRFRVSLNTGSDLLWVQCAPCLQCSDTTQTLPFDYGGSSTSKLLTCGDETCQDLTKRNSAMCTANCTAKQVWKSMMESADALRRCELFNESSFCTYAAFFGDGTIVTGKIVTDVFYLQRVTGDIKRVNIPFGCGQIVSPPFTAYGLDGTLGLMRTNHSLPSLLAAQGLPNVFAHCFATKRDEGHGGRFILGRPAVPDSFIQYTPLYGDPNFERRYRVRLLNISIGDVTFPVPELYDDVGTPTVEFDSGNTITIFPRNILRGLVLKITSRVPSLAFDNATSSRLRLTCFKLPPIIITAETVKALKLAFPNVTLHFENATMVVSPRDYLVEIGSSDTGGQPALCVGMRELPFADQFPDLWNLVSIGANFMRNYLVVYDHDNRRIGVSRMQCRSDGRGGR
ncbi:hypothetical protein CBR_g45647 [Chara braunii]|uniref:Peptidase A1 domain-containing protein n=1 Tax=Chara braunii TaxID=69332 RepID=A0A388K3F8_CHABU|nr:hypothetical protein CBR_g45647 [Chara braunii]|eukprot:GBG64590.1 hypothetical protein CBR_g45647 [Chara braunii]